VVAIKVSKLSQDFSRDKPREEEHKKFKQKWMPPVEG
jgi:hypothetical protein